MSAFFIAAFAPVVCSLFTVPPKGPQDCVVKAEQKISETEGGFGGVLDPFDVFCSVASIGDLDGDGTPDLAIGAQWDDEGGGDQGVVWILFLNPDGTVKSEQKISETAGGFGGVLDPGDWFGSLGSLGDLDNDGSSDLVVGAVRDSDGGSIQGAVWILLLNPDGTVKSEQKISEAAGGFGGVLDTNDYFGRDSDGLGDLDGDGIGDLAVCATYDDDGGTDQGAVWILFLNSDGTVKSEQKISEAAGSFGGVLDPNDRFGVECASLGDLDGDGIGELAVGAYQDDDGGSNQGAVWILFLNSDGTVKSEQKISETAGTFGGLLDPGDFFGVSVASIGDTDGDGITDLAVGAQGDDDGGTDQGAVWILLLNTDGTVKSERKISETAGGFGGALDANDQFSWSIATLGDLDGDGRPDLAVGTYGDDDGGTDQGCAWILFLDPDTTPPSLMFPPVVSVMDRKGNGPGELVYFSVTAFDDCDPAPALVCLPPSGSTFPPGTTMVTCSATDAAGNQSVSVFPVVVTPTARPMSL